MAGVFARIPIGIPFTVARSAQTDFLALSERGERRERKRGVGDR